MLALYFLATQSYVYAIGVSSESEASNIPGSYSTAG